MASPTEAPRRSSRRSKTKQYSSYNVGDVVEILRNGLEAQGRLMYKLSEGPTPNPRWLVTFDGQTWKDEELYERSFGKILIKADDADPASKSSARKGSRGKASNSNKNSNQKANNKSSGPSSGEDEEPSSKKRKTVAFTESSIVASEESSPASNAGEGAVNGKVSAREQRSLRRQAMIQDDTTDAVLQDGTKRGRSNNSMSKNNSNGSKSSKRSRKNEEVVKIPMLTGTLYLYRGLHRRAEFVRKY